MARTAHLRSRRSAAQLHALARVEREIRAQDSHHRRQYLREFNHAFRSYDSLLDTAELQTALHPADVVLIGDYHALPAAQRHAASLIELRALAGDRPVVLGVETIYARDQHILDEWWRREIDEKELRQRIRFDLDWGYDWTPFYDLLVTARDHGEAVYGLDCMPREDLRKIGARDRHAAAKIAEIRLCHPDAAIFVLFGESHLAPGHLPRELHQFMPGTKILRYYRTSTLCTGAPPESPLTKWKQFALTTKSCVSSTRHHWKNTKATGCFSISGAAVTTVPTSRLPSTT